MAFRPTQLGVILSTFFSSIVSTLFQIDAILTLILNSDIPKSSQEDLLRAERRAGQLKNVAGDGGDGHDGGEFACCKFTDPGPAADNLIYCNLKIVLKNGPSSASF